MINRGEGLNTILWPAHVVQSLIAMLCFGERDMKLVKRVRKPKKRNAWLITWESSRDDYFKDLNRPRVVAILKPQLDPSTIKKMLPILFTSESHLTFGEKIGYSFCRRNPGWLRSDFNCVIYCGNNPWLQARLVKELWVETYPETVLRQTLHWTEHARHQEDRETFKLVVVHPEYACSEDVDFDVLWYGRSFLEEDRQSPGGISQSTMSITQSRQ